MAFVPAALAAIPAWVSTAFTVGSGVVGAVGAVQGANATAAAAELTLPFAFSLSLCYI